MQVSRFKSTRLDDLPLALVFFFQSLNQLVMSLRETVGRTRCLNTTHCAGSGIDGVTYFYFFIYAVWCNKNKNREVSNALISYILCMKI